MFCLLLYIVFIYMRRYCTKIMILAHVRLVPSITTYIHDSRLE